MVLLKDSSTKEVIREQYEQLWSELLIRDEEEAELILKKIEYELLPTREKILRPFKNLTWEKTLSPFKTHLTWIIPLSVISFLLLAYVLFIYISLWIEDY
ncbi:hypothetical protein E0698_06385 [Paenibacillus sp. 23TSA30-6]|nr:hypothetical protein [Paenibacillus sp. 23TSA30-6]MBE0336120.1 hypothetical protein [Paenibacillus sp. 23TSA30-6]